MADTRSPEQRRHIMRAVGTKNTGPEIVVRSALHRAGLRFRLHRSDLPGRPDIVIPGRKAVVFVHGCFWHGHMCRKGQLPKSRTEYWQPKIDRNRERDAENIHKLRVLGWSPIIVWQCELSNPDYLPKLVARIESM